MHIPTNKSSCTITSIWISRPRFIQLITQHGGLHTEQQPITWQLHNHVHRNHLLTRRVHHLHHNKVHEIILIQIPRYLNSKLLLTSNSLPALEQAHKLRMLHHSNLMNQHPNAQQQQSPLLQPPAPGSHAAYWQQGQPQFIQLRVSPQGQPIREPRQQSPLR